MADFIPIGLEGGFLGRVLPILIQKNASFIHFLSADPRPNFPGA
jgi:hypothetical protein